MEFEPMLTPREKSPLPKMSPEEDRTRNTVDSEPKHYQLSYSGPLTDIYKYSWLETRWQVVNRWAEKKMTGILQAGQFAFHMLILETGHFKSPWKIMIFHGKKSALHWFVLCLVSVLEHHYWMDITMICVNSGVALDDLCKLWCGSRWFV